MTGRRWQVRLRPDTKDDVAEVVAWYRSEAPEQVFRFRDELQKALAAIGAYPFLYPQRVGLVRLYAMRVLPYGIWYVVDETERMVHVLAVLHFRRDPATVQARVGQMP